MASDKIQICNRALNLLKATGSILDIDNPTTEEDRIFNAWYYPVKHDVLRIAHYRDSIRRRTISADPNAPKDFTYEHKWKLPSDYVKLIGIGDLTEIDKYGYVCEDGYLCLKRGFKIRESEIVGNPDVFDINIRYIYDIPESKMSQDFAMLLSSALGACPGIATNLTDNSMLSQQCELFYANQLKKFKGTNSQESKITVVRGNGGRPGTWRHNQNKVW